MCLLHFHRHTLVCLVLCLLFLELYSKASAIETRQSSVQNTRKEPSSSDPFRQLFHLPSNPFSDLHDPFTNLVRKQFKNAPSRLFNDSPFRAAFPGFGSTTIHLPFENLFNSLLSESSTRMDVQISPDNRHLEVTVDLPPLDSDDQRRVDAKVIGGGRHLRVTITGGGLKATHTISLPKKVMGENMKIIGEPKESKVKLRLDVAENQEEAEEEDGVKMLEKFSGMGTEEKQVMEQVTDAKECQHRFGGDALKIKRCECEVADNEEDRVVCYAGLVAKGAKLVKRLGLHDVASELKHEALACADEADEKKKACLQGIVAKLMTAVGEDKGLRKRIRAEIQGDDDTGGSSKLYADHYAGSVLPGLGLWILLLGLIGLVMWLMIKEYRSPGFSHQSNGLTSRLSSALSMMSGVANGKVDFGRYARRATGHQRNMKMMKD